MSSTNGRCVSSVAGKLGTTPLFRVQLQVDGPQVRLSPPPEDLEAALQGAITAVVEAVRRFTTVDADLLSLLQLERKVIFDLHVPPVSEGRTAHLLKEARKAITGQ